MPRDTSKTEINRKITGIPTSVNSIIEFPALEDLL